MKRVRPARAKSVWSRSSGGPRRPVTWSEVERAILLRIARKEYTPGQQIPTCEALAAELGANKNTVSKAYRSLAQRGYLLTRAGFGTFISRRPAPVSTAIIWPGPSRPFSTIRAGSRSTMPTSDPITTIPSDVRM